MNEEQRGFLTKGLMNLLAAQTNVIEARRFGKGKYTDRGKALELRKEIEDWIVRFVDEITQPTSDPRAGLRRCEVASPRCTIPAGYFHCFYTDANSECSAIVEDEDGCVYDVYATNIRFTDIPEAGLLPEVKALVEFVTEWQWCDTDGYDRTCPYCGGSPERNGHAQDCKYAQALAPFEEGKT